MTRRWLAIPLAALLAAVFLQADEPKKAAAPPAAVKRTPWTTSKITGSPEPPPPFKSARVFPNVKLNHPVLIARAPGTERLFVGEQDGVLYSIANTPDAKAELFFNLKTEVKTLAKTPHAKGIGELYGLVFHPKFETNRYCYVFYTLAAKEKAPRLTDGSRLSRFTVTKTDPPRIDPDSEEIVLAYLGGGHNGGDLHFGPKDGMLYISTGDSSGPNPPDPLNTGQDCSDLSSSILRIDVDNPGEPGRVSPRRYGIPKDNPFVGMKDVRPEIWAFGFRNPWRMSFDRQTGDLWVGDVGWELWEMVHKIEKGGNYGWSITEARQPVKPDQKPGPTPIRPPTIELPHTIAMSVTGGYVYRGKKFPELAGAYVFGDWESRRIWAARFDGDRLKEMPEIVKLGIRVSCFGEDNAGEIYYFDYDTGLMYTLEKNDATGANTNFPKKLSETGLFKNVRTQDPAAGVVGFRPNTEQWMDGATARFLIALPGDSSVTAFSKPRKLPGQVFWHEFNMLFPKDAVLVKTISPAVFGRTPDVRVETQILHFDGEEWRAYTYAWREDQSDADLVPADGLDKEYTFQTRAGEHKESWSFASRTQCIVCHNAWSEYAMAFTVPQLNNSRIGAEDDFTQLPALSRAGFVRRVDEKDQPLPPYDEASAKKERFLADIGSGAYSLEERARSYLHANCAHCHRFGGGGGQVVFEMDYSKPLKETGLLDAKPKQGDFGIVDARLIAPGDPFRSVLLYRMAKYNHGRMPHLGSEKPHPFATDLIAKWIHSLKPDGKDLAFPERFGSLDRIESALPQAIAIGHGYLKGKDREAALAAAAKLPPGPVRDLFDGYLPPDPKGKRIGSNPRPVSILAKTGDPKNGEELFFNKELKCANCHKIGDKGVSLGPDLSAIGKDRTRAELLDSILFPSAKVDPKFASYLVKTHDGRSFTGLLVKRDEKQAVLRDVENKEIVLAADNIETIQPSRLSLMPDGVVSGLTPQEAADLVEYLFRRK
jgi:putative heme-binding domain-containing protein